jgi:hypothetical protein
VIFRIGAWFIVDSVSLAEYSVDLSAHNSSFLSYVLLYTMASSYGGTVVSLVRRFFEYRVLQSDGLDCGRYERCSSSSRGGERSLRVGVLFCRCREDVCNYLLVEARMETGGRAMVENRVQHRINNGRCSRMPSPLRTICLINLSIQDLWDSRIFSLYQAIPSVRA